MFHALREAAERGAHRALQRRHIVVYGGHVLLLARPP
jgi:hypothetical protein